MSRNDSRDKALSLLGKAIKAQDGAKASAVVADLQATDPEFADQVMSNLLGKGLDRAAKRNRS